MAGIIPEPIWAHFITPALTLIIIVIGFVFSKIRLEQHVVEVEKQQEKRIGKLENSLTDPNRCVNCPQIITTQKDQEVMNVRIDILCKTITENQKDTKELIKQMATTNSKVDSAMQMMSESLAFLRNKKFATAIEKILNNN